VTKYIIPLSIFIFALLIGFVSIVIYFRTNNSTVDQTEPTLPKISSTGKPVFSVENAPSQSESATISALIGNVNWISRTATEASSLPQSTILGQGETILTDINGYLTLQLKEGGTLKLSPSTEVDIVQMLPENYVFTHKQGIVTFTVTNTPLAIRAYGLLIQFSEAQARIAIDKDNETVYVGIISGSATAAYNDLSYITQYEKISKNSELIYDEASRITTIRKFIK
jgi:hypothetical protein